MAITESTINSLEFQSKLTGELDKALVQSAQTSFFADNALGIANLAGQVMGEFIRTKVSPEMDAYVLSKLATLATTKSHTVTGTPSSQVYKMITEAINKVQAVAGYDEELVCFVDSEVWSATMNTTELSRQLMVSDFRKGEINTKVKKLNDVPIIPVADDRMKTAYTFYDGVTDNSGSSGADQRPGGFVPASGAKKIGILERRKTHEKKAVGAGTDI